MEANRNGGLLFRAPVSSRGRGLKAWIAASVLLHVGLLATLFVHRAARLQAVNAPGSANGHHLMLTYTMAGGAPPSVLRSAHATPAQPASRPVPALPSQAAVAVAAAAAASTEARAGNDALGDGDLTLALVRLHPPPHPDLGQLPAGTRGDVVIDVVIDSMGHIARSTMVRGLGHGVDETVLATIQQWTFQPALRKGVPVASQQELLFHYERG